MDIPKFLTDFDGRMWIYLIHGQNNSEYFSNSDEKKTRSSQSSQC